MSELEKRHPSWLRTNLLHIRKAPNNFEKARREALYAGRCDTCGYQLGEHLFKAPEHGNPAYFECPTLHSIKDLSR